MTSSLIVTHSMSETNKDKDASLFTLKAVIDSAFEKLLNEDDDFMLNCSSFPDPQVVRKLLSQSVSKQEEQALTDQQQSGHEQKDLHYPGAQLQGLKTKSLSRKTKREYSARKPFLEAVAARTVKIAEISKKALAQCGVNNNKHSTRKPGEQEPEDALATLSIDVCFAFKFSLFTVFIIRTFLWIQVCQYQCDIENLLCGITLVNSTVTLPKQCNKLKLPGNLFM